MSRLLVELAEAERRRALSALAGCPRVDVAAGAVAELPDAALLVIEDGIVVLSGADSRRIAIAIAGPGEVLAPLGLGEHLRGLTAATVTTVTGDAKRALMHVPPAAGAVTDALVDSLRDRNASLANFARFPYAERLKGKLLQLARSHGRVAEDGVLIDLPLTHDLLAESIGSTRETVTLALHELARAGFLSRVDRRYRLEIAPEELS
jgi:CRP-like cAMP-binding protein